ncbi:cell division cycle protein 20 homolog B [Balearica regulorum gibbericeps]|uniref:cell division cycle protein 20 homolog B n=1 Tax=Balearica regulorum gibbericeps TaxID=100784 RepID=UPI00053232F5|nr:PREDICTED: cell division cycle protein 20 homolog B [Balearica regulorum gibbericeps]
MLSSRPGEAVWGAAVQVSDLERTTYSRFKSAIKRKLAAKAPVASSPIVTRWQQLHARGGAEERRWARCATDPSASGGGQLISTPGKAPVTPQVPKKLYIVKTVVTLPSSHGAADLEGWNNRTAEMEKKQKHSSQLPVVQEVGYSIAESGDMKVCENTNCIWKGCQEGTQNEFRAVTIMKPSTPLEPEVRLHITGLRNDYYLNILDWSLENLIAIAVGPAAHIWNGGTLQAIENIDLNSSSKYISSLAWIQEGTCLAIGTSDGEVQLWDIETKKRLRNMLGHLSVVGALSWNHYILSSGSRLGSIHHHDVRVAQHHVGTLCQNKQSICSLKWSLTNQVLASGSSDGILNIWPSDPGVKLQSQPLKTIPHSSAVKAVNWCPWQSNVLATGGGMKDGILRVWDINREKIIQSAATDSQICSLLWLPKTSELMTGQGLPGNQMKIWKYPILTNSSELHGHKGRVLHTALSPDHSRLFSVAADGIACLWKCHESGENKHSSKAFSNGYLNSFL